LRLQCGARELARGTSVADAAYAAGFSDAADFTGTFPRMTRLTTALERKSFGAACAARDFSI
jgi:methylphosphotriester-DNA--protein-cysteine methyltransferase